MSMIRTPFPAGILALFNRGMIGGKGTERRRGNLYRGDAKVCTGLQMVDILLVYKVLSSEYSQEVFLCQQVSLLTTF